MFAQKGHFHLGNILMGHIRAHNRFTAYANTGHVARMFRFLYCIQVLIRFKWPAYCIGKYNVIYSIYILALKGRHTGQVE